MLNKISNKTLIFWDTETTGIDPKKDYVQIIEIAGIAIDSETGKELGRYHKKSKLKQSVYDRIKEEEGKTNAIKNASLWVPNKKYARDDVVIHEDEYYVVLQNTTTTEPSTANSDWKHLKKRDIENRKTIEDLLVMTRYKEANTDFVAEKDMLVGFSDFVKKFKNPVLIAHNSNFDMYQLNSGISKFDKSKKVRAEQLDTLAITRNYLIPILKQMEKIGDKKAEAGLMILKQGGKRILSNLNALGQLFDVQSEGWHGGLEDSAQLAGITSKMIDYIQQNKDIVQDFEVKKKRK